MANKIDSNVTGLRFAEEVEDDIGVLPSTPIWYPLEPNSYSDFGGEPSLIARNTINDSRQRKKGVIVDLDASGGLNQDLTQENIQNLLQGYFFASLRLKAQTKRKIIDITADDVSVTAVDGTGETYTITNLQATAAVVNAGGTGYTVGDVLTVQGGTGSVATQLTVLTAPGGVVGTVSVTRPGRYSTVPANPVAVTGGTGGDDATFDLTTSAVATYRVGDLLKAADFDEASNEGLKRVTVVTGDTVLTVAENLVTDASPGTNASLTVVGFQFAAGDLDVDASGSYPAITSTVKDLTQLGCIPGDWVRIGGDTAATQFDTAANNGMARVRTVATNRIEFDKTENTMVTEANVGDTIQVFVGRVLKNELAALIRRRTYNLERTLGEDDDGTMSEYLVGSVASELSLNMATADKITSDLSFIAIDNEQRTGLTGVKSGDRPALVEADAFNTSSDVSRIKLSIFTDGTENPTPLFAFLQEFTLNINNNLSPNKAISRLGAFDVTAGNFAVSGSMTAYFSDIAAVQAVRDNEDVTLDMFLVKNNAGVVVDIPLLALGDGRANVELDQAITLPLTFDAATASKFDTNLDHTLLMCFFDYLPSAADS